MVAGTGDGSFLSLGMGVRALISSSVGSFGFVEPCGFGFHFLSTGSDLEGNLHLSGDFGKKKRREGIPPPWSLGVLKEFLGLGWGGELLLFEKGFKAGEKGLRGSWVSFLGILRPWPTGGVFERALVGWKGTS